MNCIPRGKWAVKVIAHRLERASTGTEMVVVTFEDDTGQRIDWYGPTTDRALRYTLAALERLGWRAEDHDGEIRVLNGSDLLVGARAEIEVVDDVWDGRTKPKVKWVNRPKSAPRGALSAKEAAEVSARLRTRILEAAAGRDGSDRGAPGGETPPTAAAGDTPHDDIPF